MVTSGQTKSVMRKFTFQNASHMLTFSQANPQSQSLRKRKNIAYIYKHQTQIFKELVPSLIPLLKEHIRLWHADTVDHSVQFIDTILKKNIKGEWTHIIHFIQIANAKYQCPMAASCTHHRLLSPRPRPRPKAIRNILRQNIRPLSKAVAKWNDTFLGL